MTVSLPPHCVNRFGTFASADRKCPVFLDEEAIQELRGKYGLFFLDIRKKFLVNEPKTGTPSCALALMHSQGINAATVTTALPYQGDVSAPPQTIVATQSEVSAQNADPNSVPRLGHHLPSADPSAHLPCVNPMR
jgi:hypothetical protein